MSDVDPIRASSVKPEAIRWLWQDRIPLGTLTVIAGRPGQGKSLLTAYLAAEVSKQGNVIFSNLEDPVAQVVRPRLQVAGAKLDRVHFWTPILPADVDALEARVRQLKAKLVILDPIAAHLTVAIYSDQDVRRALTPLTAMAARTGCAIVAVHHTVKKVAKGSHPLEAIGGSSGGLTGAARAVFIFGPNPLDPDERIIAAAKQNLGPPRPSLAFELDEAEIVIGKYTASVGRLELRGEEPAVSAIDVATFGGHGGDDSPGAAKKAIAAEWLTNYLCLGGRPANEIREDAVQSGISWATVRRGADEIGVVKARTGFGKGSFVSWLLPAGHPALIEELDDEEAAAPENGVATVATDDEEDVEGGDDE